MTEKCKMKAFSGSLYWNVLNVKDSNVRNYIEKWIGEGVKENKVFMQLMFGRGLRISLTH